MPYRFELKGYCENCSFFEPEVEKIEHTKLEDEFPKVENIVKCRYGEQCERAVITVNREMV